MKRRYVRFTFIEQITRSNDLSPRSLRGRGGGIYFSSFCFRAPVRTRIQFSLLSAGRAAERRPLKSTVYILQVCRPWFALLASGLTPSVWCLALGGTRREVLRKVSCGVQLAGRLQTTAAVPLPASFFPGRPAVGARKGGAALTVTPSCAVDTVRSHVV